MEIKNILVTGSDGYIGSVLVQKLVENKFNVTGLDTLYFRQCFLGPYKISYPLVNTDIRKIDALNLEQYDAVIHLAALSTDPISELNSTLTHRINFLSTINLAQKAKKAGVKRFIFSSSCTTYGVTDGSIVNETVKMTPMSAYAKSKFLSEQALAKLASRNFCVCLLRNSTVCGFSPKLRTDLVVNNLVSSAVTSNKILVMSDGYPWRALIDIRDLASIYLKFLDVDSKDVNAQLINIGFNENNFRVKDIVSEIKKISHGYEAVFLGNEIKYPLSYRVNFDKLKAILTHKREWPLEKSIKDLITRLNKEGFQKKDFDSGKFSRVNTMVNLIKNGSVNKQFFWKIQT